MYDGKCKQVTVAARNCTMKISRRATDQYRAQTMLLPVVAVYNERGLAVATAIIRSPALNSLSTGNARGLSTTPWTPDDGKQ